MGLGRDLEEQKEDVKTAFLAGVDFGLAGVACWGKVGVGLRGEDFREG